ncbi:GntR family transcriptional regulator [Streptomyces sp. NPDC048514]|uniref:GntR family transcriptional regulator n=1 Tax=Streptomyces sp. NPDC048514 TaxID=3365564 RepID=UPI003719DA65
MAYEVEAPKYVRLARTIQRRIEDGTYPPGTRVPSENQLMQAFGMSRPTVVRALELLKRDGWPESRRGYGTIVRGRPAAVDRKDRRGRDVLERDESRAPGRLVEVGEVSVPARVASVLRPAEARQGGHASLPRRRGPRSCRVGLVLLPRRPGRGHRAGEQ